MNRKKLFNLTDEMKDKIISAAYGDASLLDRIKIFYLIKKNDEARKLFLEYRKTAGEVRQLGEEEYPESIARAVESKTIGENRSGNFLFDLYSVIISKPLISAATTFILVAAITVALIVNKPIEYKYSEAEIIKADQQTRHALAIVENIFRQTQSTLQKEVLGEKVAKPINHGIGIINNLFEGEKNETN